MRTRDISAHQRDESPSQRSVRWPARRLLTLAALVLLALLVALLAQMGGAPVAAAQGMAGSAALRPTHALPVRTDPAANAILSAPPSQVKIWFDEAINPLDSRIVVVDPSNHEVDTKNSSVNMSGQTEMVVGLHLLRPGTYVVVWRAQSTDDGHVTGGSFIFRIANADGSVPPLPKTLSSGNVPGAAGFGSSAQAVDGPTLLQAFCDWLALLFALFWVGGLIWEVWALPARRMPNAIVALGARLGAQRFQRLTPYALVGALLADVGMALALTVEVAGSWRGVFAPQFWQATIFGGSFGEYWWMRQAVLLAALALTLWSARRAPGNTAAGVTGALSFGAPDQQDGAQEAPSWTRAALDVLCQTPRLPIRLAQGWRDASWLRRAEVALGALMLFAFTMSGHAAATPPSVRTYAIIVDVTHLIFTAAWLGGLLYISVVLIPAARALPERAQALLLARGAPEFGVVAIVSAAALAVTGPLNAGVHLTSLAQIATTAYGRVLFVKSELFLIMVVISAYHAFSLRPRLTRSLERSAQARFAALRQVAGVGALRAAQNESADAAELLDETKTTLPRMGAVAANGHTVSQNGHAKGYGANSADTVSAETGDMRRRMEDWLRREALLGVGVLLCVALLALFAGSLTPAQAAIPAAASTGAFRQTHTVSGYAITLQIAPARFGQNTFTVTVTDAQGKPVHGAKTQLITYDIDMDMGQLSTQMQPVGASQPGVYSAQSDLTMAGDWSATVQVTPSGAKNAITTTYKLPVGE